MMQQISRPIPCILVFTVSTGVRPYRPQTASVLLLSVTVYMSTAIQATNSVCLIIISYCLHEYSHTGHKQRLSYYYQLLSTWVQPYRPQTAPVLLLSVTVYMSTVIQATNSTCLIIISYCLHEYSHTGQKQHLSYYYQLLSTGIQPYRPQTAHLLLLILCYSQEVNV